MQITSLKDILLNTTPRHVVERYNCLFENSEVDTQTLESGLIMLDTETTGLSFHDDSLTQIAAVRIERGEVVDTFNTFVHPPKPIPEHISALTHIYNKDVADAPSPQEAVAQLTHFVGGLPIVAHNAQFDKTFVEGACAHGCVTTRWVDSLALSKIAFPSFSSHKLEDMARVFGCESVTHRADDDARALAGVWHYMMCALMDVPHDIISLFAHMHEEDVPHDMWAYRFIFSEIERLQQLQERAHGDEHDTPDDSLDATRLSSTRIVSMLKKERRARVFCTEKETTAQALQPPTQTKSPACRDGLPTSNLTVTHDIATTSIEEDFSQTGIMADVFSCAQTEHDDEPHIYEERAEQTSMAQYVFHALNHSKHAVIEAPTGVGKSMAYLVPAIKKAIATQEPIGIATKTNALADQLIQKDLPRLAHALQTPLSYVVVKGVEHYPSLENISYWITHPFDKKHVSTSFGGYQVSAPETLTAFALVIRATCERVNIDVDDLGIRWKFVPRDLIIANTNQTTSGYTHAQAGNYLIQELHTRAQTCDIVVTNQALLLIDIDASHAIFPKINNWIVDEAHAFADQARQLWAQHINLSTCASIVRNLGDAHKHLLGDISSAVQGSDGRTLIYAQISTVCACATTLLEQAEAFFELSQKLATHTHAAHTLEAPQTQSVRITPEMRAGSVWTQICEKAPDMYLHLHELAHSISKLVGVIKGTKADTYIKNLKNIIADLENAEQALRLVIDGSNPEYVYTLDETLSSKRTQVGFSALTLDVGARLARNWYDDMNSVIYTSATLTIDNSFDYFLHTVGLDHMDETQCTQLRVGSVFDYDRNMCVLVPSDIADPTSNNYLDELEQVLFDIHIQMQGSVLTLFTSRKDMEYIHKRLAPKLAEHQLELLYQAPRVNARYLLQRFCNTPSTSLMALKTFWEGIDAPGSTLRCVVVTRLPFLPPCDPVMEELSSRDKRAWWRYALPEAVMQVKQAAGRLIRTKTDEGFIVLADRRILTKGYGAVFTRSLPTSDYQAVSCARIAQYMDLWQQGHTFH